MPLAPASAYLDAFLEGLAPDPDLTVDEWADQKRFLSDTASAERGPWRTSRTPYLRAIMQALSPSHPCRRVVLVGGAQVGKTECGNNWLGYVVDVAPGPMLMVQPTLDTARRVSKQRIAPMIASTPALSSKVQESRARDSGNTLLTKEFAGGILLLTGANSGAGLRSMPIKYLDMDEVDEYPGDVEGQGDPVALAERRTSNFPQRKIFLKSTPTIRGLSRIEREYLKSDQRRYYLPCPHCGHYDSLTWREPGRHRIEFDGRDPGTARMVCGACNRDVPERWKTQMLERGEWRATVAEYKGDTVGFHLSSLYSPLGWKSWAECAAEFLAARDDRFKLKTWINTVLGETFTEDGDSVEPGALARRRVQYTAEVPNGVGVLVAAVDVQGDRLEVAVVGYGAGEESWLVAFHQIMGDPGAETRRVWYELDAFLSQSFTHESGRKMRITCCTVDSGGAHTEHVYRYCRAREQHRVYAVKGGTETGKPLVGRASRNNRYRVALFVLCTDTGKDVVTSRLRVSAPGHGYCWLPNWVDDEFLEQLCAEKAIRKYVKGRGAVRQWEKVRERNEALDLYVYALAALYICGPTFLRSLGERAARLAAPLEPDTVPAPARLKAPHALEQPAQLQEPAPAVPPRVPRVGRPRKGWANRW